MNYKSKKGITSEVIMVFVLVLVVSILAGMTFLFTSGLKTQTATGATVSSTQTLVNETITLSNAGSAFSVSGLRNCILTSAQAINASGAEVISSTNYTLNSPSNCYLKAATASLYNGTSMKVTYSYTYVPYTIAETSVNATEAAGATIVNYLPLLFLAIIFGAILAVVLKIIMPYINLGNQVSGF